MKEARAGMTERLHRAGDSPRPLGHGEVHVWFASLRVPADSLKDLDESLSSGERARAERFRDPRDRDRFVAAHGIAREILGGYAGMEPRDLRFETDRAGRPSLGRTSGGESLAFSMSHSGDAALYGVARERNVGVDIELVDRNLFDERVSRRILSPAERAALDALLPAAQVDALFRFWTLKEAYLKARGEGLAIPPSAIDVSAISSGAKTLPGGAKGEDGVPWTLAAVPIPPGYAAAAACRGSGRRIVCGLFDDRVADPAGTNGSA